MPDWMKRSLKRGGRALVAAASAAAVGWAVQDFWPELNTWLSGKYQWWPLVVAPLVMMGGKALRDKLKASKWSWILPAFLALALVSPSAYAQDKAFGLPDDLLSGSLGVDFELNDLALATLGVVSIYDTVDIRIGGGAAREKYSCWALGADLDVPKLTRGKVRYTLPVGMKLGVYWLPERIENEDGSKALKHHGGVTLSITQAL